MQSEIAQGVFDLTICIVTDKQEPPCLQRLNRGLQWAKIISTLISCITLLLKRTQEICKAPGISDALR